MPGEISLPFKSNGIATSALKKLPFDSKASALTVDHGGEYITVNYLDLLPGDVILFDTGKFDPILTPSISRYQEQVLKDKNDARWKHVGILDDNLLVWDAMPSLDVRSRPLREVLTPLSRICIRRSRIVIDVDKLRDALLQVSNTTQYRFATKINAALALRLLTKRLGKRKWKAEFTPKKVVCSIFVATVLWRATGHDFIPDVPIVVPGDFASDPDFQAIEVEWCCMEKPTPPPKPEANAQPSA